jgi:hypothetical protein
MNFTATSTSQLLTFLSGGSPGGEPPVALLDGVSMVDSSAVPEPGSILLVVGGIGVLGLFRKRASGKGAKAK